MLFDFFYPTPLYVRTCIKFVRMCLTSKSALDRLTFAKPIGLESI